DVTIIVSADAKYESMIPAVLQSAVASLPRVEEIVGEYPYDFAHFYITDLPVGMGGGHTNGFIWISSNDFNNEIVAHELTHATLYGIFPKWFEEGVAYYVGAYSSGALQSAEALALSDIAYLKAQRKLDLNAKYEHSYLVAYFSNIRQGFLFFKG